MDRKVTTFLETQRVPYRRIPHRPAFTAMETAEAAHVPGRELAKTVILRVDEQLVMAVVPATHQVQLNQLRRVARGWKTELTREQEFADVFPDCERGAMPPFGNLYGMKVYASDALRDDAEIAFNNGTHAELVKISWQDFERLVKPIVGPISIPHPRGTTH